MGFDLYIRLNMMLDKHTGLPIVWSNEDDCFIPYEPSKWIVPVEYRKWIEQRGSHFHHYIPTDSQVSAEQFIESYPEWDMIEIEIDFNECGWCKEDHDAFRLALEWFSSKGGFSVDWSY